MIRHATASVGAFSSRASPPDAGEHPSVGCTHPEPRRHARQRGQRASQPTSFTFNSANRAVPGEYDFFGFAYHEVTEVMGRYGMTQNSCGLTACLSPIDLFRYTGPGQIDVTPTNGSYFSIDGGKTRINTFNGIGGGDLSDWLGLTNDAFNAFSSEGVENPFSAGDATLMDILGYNLSSVPEPGTGVLVMVGLLGVAAMRRKVGVTA